MADQTPLAHSRRGDVPEQTYAAHVLQVRRCAVENARHAAAFYRGDRDDFVASVDAAAIFHDLGKLDQANQDVLRGDSLERLPIAHDDAGVAELESLGRLESAVLVAAHHAGLFSRKSEMQKQGRPFRRLEVADHVDALLKEEYLPAHVAAGCGGLGELAARELSGCGFTRRLALSCLVDADHGDTARHYRQEVETPRAETRWRERAAALETYVNALPRGKTERERRRNGLRARVYQACRDAEMEPPIRACDAPVGIGKTTAVMAHLLRAAVAKQLRHVFVVLPYTNIITQAVEVYREALVMDGERPEDVVAEHHHQADFADLELRQLCTLWKAPVIITTAVQFFETLASSNPARLRKLHELPGSAVFVDETHAAIPSHLWPQMWRWLATWARDWGGHLVLASGSLPRFWELDGYRSLIQSDSAACLPDVPDLVSDEPLRMELHTEETHRVKYRRRDDQPALDLDGLIDFVAHKPGPRLLIVNTVQTAAVVADTMRELRHDVLHLSTALAPVHRDVVVSRVKRRLRDGIEDWTLIATSCVEAGMDFSFRTGFRERASTASLIQIGGRVNRGYESAEDDVWDLLLRDERFACNRALMVPRQALDQFNEVELNSMRACQLATLAMQREWNAGSEEMAREIVRLEEQMEYPSVASDCRVIANDTRTVVIDKALADSVRKRRRVSRTELLRYSVQIWAEKVDKLALTPLSGARTNDRDLLYEWTDAYEADFLGYMAGIVRLNRFLADGGAII